MVDSAISSDTSPVSVNQKNRAQKNVSSRNDAFTRNALKHPSQRIALSFGGQPYAPHPFILQPPRTGQLDYAPGDTFTCNITLIGEAINLLPWIVLTFQEIGKRRIGLRDKRGQCELSKVESLSARDEHQTQTIYTAESEMLTDDGLDSPT